MFFQKLRDFLLPEVLTFQVWQAASHTHPDPENPRTRQKHTRPHALAVVDMYWGCLP